MYSKTCHSACWSLAAHAPNAAISHRDDRWCASSAAAIAGPAQESGAVVVDYRCRAQKEEEQTFLHVYLYLAAVPGPTRTVTGKVVGQDCKRSAPAVLPTPKPTLAGGSWWLRYVHTLFLLLLLQLLLPSILTRWRLRRF